MSHIGQYRLVRKLGAGGMGAVFLGEHVLLGRRAAIKTLLPTLSRNEEIVERFFNEARATSSISDPGVVQIYDFGYHVDGTAYIVLELLEGESLANRLDRLGQLSVFESLRIARQLSASLASAHECGVVHRDLKPDNIFLVHDVEAQSGERTKILDFGICKLQSRPARITASGMMVGTPVYMSPEQCRGDGEVDHRADIYALGCVLFHMLTGRAPFEHDAPGDFIVSHMREHPPTPSSIVPALPPMVDELLEHCLAKSRSERFQSMTALHAAIEHVLAHTSATGVAAAASRRRLVLGTGFRSVYDANLGSAVATRDVTPTPLPVPRSRGAVKVFVGLAVVLAIIAGFVATRFDIGGTSAVAEPAYHYTQPMTVTAEPSRTPSAEPVAEPPPVEDAPPLAEIFDQPKPKAPHRAPVKRAAPRPKAPATEDLYDTR